MPARELIALFASVATFALSYFWARRRSAGSRFERPHLDPQRRSLAKLALVLAAGLGGLSIRLLYVTVMRADSLNSRTGAEENGDVLSNPRLIESALKSGRGRILDRHGTVLAETVGENGTPTRVFRSSDAAHVLGYFSPLRYGLAGVEGSRDAELTGTEALTVREAIESMVRGPGTDGHDVRLTIDGDLQTLAGQLLTGVVGSATLIEPHTGRILAMASSPAYDPNALTTSRSTDIKQVDTAWSELVSDNNRPLLLRATSGLYPPGSTFKVLTASAGLRTGAITPATRFEDNGSLNVDGRIIPEFNRPDESKTVWTVTEGLAYSLNVVYAQIGLAIGGDAFRSAAADFGIGDTIPCELPVEPGQISGKPAALDDPVALADTAFGQGALLVTPLHMAMVMCAIANRGRICKPILVDAVLKPDGSQGTHANVDTWRRPIDEGVANTVLSMLYESVAYGYASRAAISGLNVAGKTGTAESGQDAPHGWFIGAAGLDAPSVVVSVCLDYGGEGGGLALEIGRTMLDAAVDR